MNSPHSRARNSFLGDAALLRNHQGGAFSLSDPLGGLGLRRINLDVNEADDRHGVLLASSGRSRSARRKRPRGCRAAEQRDEGATVHSIISSAGGKQRRPAALVFSGALRVRRNHGDANMHGGHDLAPRLGVKPIGELVQPLVQSAPKLNAGGNR
jgi:hypothetical protein